ncbi:MAG: putative tricarboxylic transport rane protein [Clostridia bacterium]|nr:putative tricarboxylic transport rane protein [Clostridia bacterium]
MAKDTLSSLVLAGIGLFFLIYSRQYDWGNLASPGEAVFPLLLAVAVLVMAGWLFGHSILGRKTAEEEGVPTGENSLRVLILTVLIVGALLLMDVLGFFTSSFILVLLCCRLLGVRQWSLATGIAAGAALGAYLIFGFWLKVSFPAGLLI